MLREPRTQLAVADAPVLDVVVLVEATLEPAWVRLEGGDRLVDGAIDVLCRTRQDVRAKEALGLVMQFQAPLTLLVTAGTLGQLLFRLAML